MKDEKNKSINIYHKGCEAQGTLCSQAKIRPCSHFADRYNSEKLTFRFGSVHMSVSKRNTVFTHFRVFRVNLNIRP